MHCLATELEVLLTDVVVSKLKSKGNQRIKCSLPHVMVYHC